MQIYLAVIINEGSWLEGNVWVKYMDLWSKCLNCAMMGEITRWKNTNRMSAIVKYFLKTPWTNENTNDFVVDDFVEQIKIQIVASLHTLILPHNACYMSFFTSLLVYSEPLSDPHVRLNKSRLHCLCFQKVAVRTFWKIGYEYREFIELTTTPLWCVYQGLVCLWIWLICWVNI